MAVIALRTREQIAQDERASELPHRRDFADPTDKRIGSPLGRAAILGLISEREYEAGCAWGEIHGDYIQTIQNPGEFSDERCERALEKYKKGIEILSSLPRRVFHAVMAMAAYGEDWGDIDYVAATAKRGLSELSDKF